jgi:hypothetical protein
VLRHVVLREDTDHYQRESGNEPYNLRDRHQELSPLLVCVPFVEPGKEGKQRKPREDAADIVEDGAFRAETGVPQVT